MRIRLLSLAALLLCLAVTLPPGSVAAQEEPRPAAEAMAAEELTEQDILFAYHRLAGTVPDFRVLAELAVAARPPSPTPPRDPVAEHRYLLALAMRRLRAEFDSFDLNRRFTIAMETEILGHDAERGGIPLDLGAPRGLFLRDPTGRGHGFILRFRNAQEIGVIPVASAAAASALLREARLAAYGDWAGRGIVTLTFAFAGLLPRLPEIPEALLSAEIVEAQVQSATGETLHVFDGVGSVMAAAAARQAGPAPLRTAELAGLRIGMPLGEAWRLASQTHPERRGWAFFDRLPEVARRGFRGPDCSAGLVADIRAFDLPLSPEDAYGACIALSGGTADDPLAGRLTEVAQISFLAGALPDEVHAQLEERFGPPLEELAEGRLVWIGQDPAAPGASPGTDPATGLVELRAEFVRVAEGGPKGQPGMLLALTLRRYQPSSAYGS